MKKKLFFNILTIALGTLFVFSAIGFAQEINPELFKTGASNYKNQKLDDINILEYPQQPEQLKILQQRDKQVQHPKLFRPRINRVSQPMQLFQNVKGVTSKKLIFNSDKSVDSLNLLVNGLTSDSLTVGDQPVFTFNFPDGISTADFYIYLDLNADGILDSADILIDNRTVTDGDEMDDGPVDGSYNMILGDETEGMNKIVGSIIYEVVSGNSAENVHILWKNIDSEYSVSGLITREDDGTPIPQIIVFVGELKENNGDEDDDGLIAIGITNSSGEYSLNVAESDSYFVAAFDHLGVTEGLVPDPMDHIILIDGHITEVDFNFFEPNSAIYGYVLDEMGTGIEEIRIYAHDDGQGYQTETDAEGYYRIPIAPGHYQINIESDDVIPEYMVPQGNEAQVFDDDSTYVEFVLYATDATISGTVFLDGTPAPGITIEAWHEHWFDSNLPNYGWTETTSDESGFYELHVKSTTDSSGYGIGVYDIADNIIIENQPHSVQPGTTGLDINLITVNGGLFGAIIDAASGDTLMESIWLDARNINTGNYYYSYFDWETGEYDMPLPDGFYELYAGGEGYMEFRDTVEISGVMIQYDIYLEEMSFDGAVYGNITDCMTGFAIAGAEVNIGNNMYWDMTYTDEYGYYYLEVPNGNYGMGVLPPPGYMEVWKQISVYDEEVEMNICLETYETDGVFEGMVFGETGDKSYEPLPYAGVHVHNWQNEFFQVANDSGGFHFNLPNGNYWVEIFLEGYLPQLDSISINNDNIYREYYLDLLHVEGVIAGRVFDQKDNFPIGGANIYIANYEDSIAFHQTSGPEGFYAFGVPNGTYAIKVMAPEYSDYFQDSIIVLNDTVIVPIPMEKFGGRIFGHVYNEASGTPIPWAWIDIQNYENGEMYNTETNGEGYFDIGIPNGVYQVTAGKETFNFMTTDSVFVYDSDVYLEFYLRKEMGDQQPPHILNIVDIPHDQGKQVRLVWNSGYLEWGVFKEFSIWRWVHDDLWDYITTVPFAGYGDYSYVAPTLIDSNAHTGPEQNFWSTFLVVAHTQMPDFFLISEPDQGYSIDNLFPSPPANPKAIAKENDITVSWRPTLVEDFDYYSIYRGTSSGFEISEPFEMTSDTLYIDNTVDQNITYYYKIVAVDFSGNLSPPSEEVNAKTVSINPEDLVPEEYVLNQNYPNPFNPETTINFGLPEDSKVTLIIYNLNGQLIRKLSKTHFQAGYHNLIWDGNDNKGALVGSGVYIYSINAGTFHQTKKMILLR